MELRSWIKTIAPSYLQDPMSQAILDGYGQVADSVIADAESARREFDIRKCADDTLPYHYYNFHAIESPLETKKQAREYLYGMFDHWRANGTVEHLLAELKRFGIPKAKVWTWSDLMLAGIPKAFGGNWITLGTGTNGKIRYLPKAVNAIPDAREGGAGWKIKHVADLIHDQITFSVDNPSKTLTIHLAFDGISVTSTVRDVVFAIGADPVARTYFFALYTGDGTGIAPLTPTAVGTMFAYYSYYFIDVYDADIFPTYIQWNDPAYRWNDGIAIWDGAKGIDGTSFLRTLREVIRRASPAGTSCRFLRVFDSMGVYPIPIGSFWEEDSSGNMYDFYTTGY